MSFVFFVVFSFFLFFLWERKADRILQLFPDGTVYHTTVQPHSQGLKKRDLENEVNDSNLSPGTLVSYAVVIRVVTQHSSLLTLRDDLNNGYVETYGS